MLKCGGLGSARLNSDLPCPGVACPQGHEEVMPFLTGLARKGHFFKEVMQLVRACVHDGGIVINS